MIFRRLHDGLKNMGLELFVQNPDARLPTVTTIKVIKELNTIIKNYFARVITIKLTMS